MAKSKKDLIDEKIRKEIERRELAVSALRRILDSLDVAAEEEQDTRDKK